MSRRDRQHDERPHSRESYRHGTQNRGSFATSRSHSQSDEYRDDRKVAKGNHDRRSYNPSQEHAHIARNRSRSPRRDSAEQRGRRVQQRSRSRSRSPVRSSTYSGDRTWSHLQGEKPPAKLSSQEQLDMDLFGEVANMQLQDSMRQTSDGHIAAASTQRSSSSLRQTSGGHIAAASTQRSSSSMIPGICDGDNTPAGNVFSSSFLNAPPSSAGSSQTAGNPPARPRVQDNTYEGMLMQMKAVQHQQIYSHQLSSDRTTTQASSSSYGTDKYSQFTGTKNEAYGNITQSMKNPQIMISPSSQTSQAMTRGEQRPNEAYGSMKPPMRNSQTMISPSSQTSEAMTRGELRPNEAYGSIKPPMRSPQTMISPSSETSQAMTRGKQRPNEAYGGINPVMRDTQSIISPSSHPSQAMTRGEQRPKEAYGGINLPMRNTQSMISPSSQPSQVMTRDERRPPHQAQTPDFSGLPPTQSRVGDNTYDMTLKRMRPPDPINSSSDKALSGFDIKMRQQNIDFKGDRRLSHMDQSDYQPIKKPRIALSRDAYETRPQERNPQHSNPLLGQTVQANNEHEVQNMDQLRNQRSICLLSCELRTLKKENNDLMEEQLTRNDNHTLLLLQENKNLQEEIVQQIEFFRKTIEESKMMLPKAELPVIHDGRSQTDRAVRSDFSNKEYGSKQSSVSKERHDHINWDMKHTRGNTDSTPMYREENVRKDRSRRSNSPSSTASRKTSVNRTHQERHSSKYDYGKGNIEKRESFRDGYERKGGEREIGTYRQDLAKMGSSLNDKQRGSYRGESERDGGARVLSGYGQDVENQLSKQQKTGNMLSQQHIQPASMQQKQLPPPVSATNQQRENLEPPMWHIGTASIQQQKQLKGVAQKQQVNVSTTQCRHPPLLSFGSGNIRQDNFSAQQTNSQVPDGIRSTAAYIPQRDAHTDRTDVNKVMELASDTDKNTTSESVKWQPSTEFKASTLLQDFHNQTIPHLQLKDLVHSYIEFAMDAKGSQFILDKLDSASLAMKAIMFGEIIPAIDTLIMHGDGHHIIFKFLEIGSVKQKQILAQCMRGNVAKLSIVAHGAELMSSALKSASAQLQMRFLNELNLAECAKIKIKTKMVQTLINGVLPVHHPHIVKALDGQEFTLLSHLYGSQVVACVLAEVDSVVAPWFFAAFYERIDTLLYQPPSSLLIEYVLEHGSAEVKSRIVNKIQGKILNLSQQRFSSSVVEKCIIHSSPKDRALLIDEVCSMNTKGPGSSLYIMMNDPFAEAVMQKLIDFAEPAQCNVLIQKIKSLQPPGISDVQPFSAPVPPPDRDFTDGVHTPPAGPQTSETIPDSPRTITANLQARTRFEEQDLLQELRNKKLPNLKLKQLVGHVEEFTSDQLGSKFIIDKLPSATLADKDLLIAEILPSATSIIMNQFGNRVVQNLLEVGSPQQRFKLAHSMEGHVHVLCLDVYGSAVIQKAVQWCPYVAQDKLVRELDVMACATSQIGNCLLQKVIDCAKPQQHKFIIDTLKRQAYKMFTHEYGINLMTCILEHCATEDTLMILDKLHKNFLQVAQHPAGSKVIEHLLKHGSAGVISKIVKAVRGKMLMLSQSRCSSNVVIECLEQASTRERVTMISEVCSMSYIGQKSDLYKMMNNRFSNAVMQKVIDVADPTHCDILMPKILPYVKKNAITTVSTDAKASSSPPSVSVSTHDGTLVAAANKQQVPRLILHKLQSTNLSDMEMVIFDVLPSIQRVMIDGSQAIQNLFDNGSSEEKQRLAQSLRGDQSECVLKDYGHTIVLKAVQCCQPETQLKLVKDLDMSKCITNTFGTSLVKEVLTFLNPDHQQLIIDAVAQIFSLLAQPNGLSLITHIFNHHSTEQTTEIAAAIHKSFNLLVNNQFGCRIIQQLLEHGKPEDISKVITAVTENVLSLSRLKFASYLVQKCLTCGSASDLTMLVDKVCSLDADGQESDLLIMAKDLSATFAFQEIVAIAEAPQLKILLQKLQPHYNHLVQHNIAHIAFNKLISRARIKDVNISDTHESEPARPKLLTDYLSKKLPNLQLKQLTTHVVEFTEDKLGSKFILEKLESASPEDKDMLINAISPAAERVMMSKSGSQITQKLIQIVSDEQKQKLTLAIESHVHELSLDGYGSAVIQKTIMCCPPDIQNRLLKKLNVLTCAKHQIGYCLLQKVIESVKPDQQQIIIEALHLQRQAFLLFTDRYSHHLLTCILEHCSSEQTAPIISRIHKHIDSLVMQQYGCKVVEYVLEHGSAEDKSKIIEAVNERIDPLSRNKVASDLVVKCLTESSQSERTMMIDKICSDVNIIAMVRNQFANQVIRKVVELAEPSQRGIIKQKIQPQFISLRSVEMAQDIIAMLDVSGMETSTDSDVKDTMVSVVSKSAAKLKAREGSSRSLLDDFQNGQLESLELNDLFDDDNVLQFSKNKLGSMFIVAELSNATEDEKDFVFESIFPTAIKLMLHPISNCVVKKYFEIGSMKQKQELAKIMQGHIVYFATMRYTYELIEYGIQFSLPDVQIEMVKEFDGHVVNCAKHEFGSLALQKVIEFVNPVHLQFIIDALLKDDVSVFSHKCSHRVIECILEHFTAEQTAPILSKIHANFDKLINQNWGSKIIQHVLENGSTEDKSQIAMAMHGKMMKLNTCSSVVMEKCIINSSPSDRAVLIDQVCDMSADGPNSALCTMMSTRFWSKLTVMQKLIDFAEPSQRIILAQKLEPHIGTFGKSPIIQGILDKLGLTDTKTSPDSSDISKHTSTSDSSADKASTVLDEESNVNVPEEMNTQISDETSEGESIVDSSVDGGKLLQRFRDNSFPNLELEDVVNHVVKFSQDELGSKFILNKLDSASLEEKDMVFKEILLGAQTLLTNHVHGASVLSKFFEIGSTEQKQKLALFIRGQVTRLLSMKHTYGLILYAIEFATPDTQLELVAELHGTVMKFVTHAFGIKVLQKVIECVSHEHVQFIIDAIIKQASTVFSHQCGSLLIRCILDRCNSKQSSAIISAVRGKLFELDQHNPYLCDVVEVSLEHSSPSDRATLISAFCSMNAFGSRSTLSRILNDEFSSSLVDKVLDIAEPSQREVLSKKIDKLHNVYHSI